MNSRSRALCGASPLGGETRDLQTPDPPVEPMGVLQRELSQLLLIISYKSQPVPLMIQLPHLEEADPIYGNGHYSENGVLTVTTDKPSPSVEAIKV